MEDERMQMEETSANETQLTPEEEGSESTLKEEPKGADVEETQPDALQQKAEAEQDEQAAEHQTKEGADTAPAGPTGQTQQFLVAMAERSGMEVEEFIASTCDMIEQTQQKETEQKIMMRARQLVEQGTPPAVAVHTANVEMENTRFRSGVEHARLQTDMKNSVAHTFSKDVGRLEEAYPDVRELKELPREALDAFSKGMTPLEAFQNHLIKEKDREIEALRQHKQNKTKTTGSVRGTAVVPEDEFVQEMRKYM